MRPLQTSFLADIPLTRPKSLVTSKPTTPDPDGATEKMLPDEEQKVSPNSNINAGDVKFVTNEKQNGDAKIDIGKKKHIFKIFIIIHKKKEICYRACLTLFVYSCL